MNNTIQATRNAPHIFHKMDAAGTMPNKSLEDNGGLAGGLLVGSMSMLSGFRAVPQLWCWACGDGAAE
jgi:predicted lipid-binding transport protein (Tim44 family)